MNIEIDNINEAQYYAIQAMLYKWQYFGEQGMSRITAFYADGDGNFRPKIKIDKKKISFPEIAIGCELSEDLILHPKNDDYAIDYDAIAWKLREKREKW